MMASPATLEAEVVADGSGGNGLTGPVIRRHRLGAELRKLREARDLRLEDAALVLGLAASTLSRIETGHAPTRTSYLAMLLDLYGVTDEAERRRLTDLAREGQRKGWWAAIDHLLPAGAGTYLGLEAASAQIRIFAVQILPGLLQTPAYAQAACRGFRPELAAGDINSLVEAARRRQDEIQQASHLHVIIDESVLLRRIVPPRVMAGQRSHLLESAACPSITIQVLPLSAPGPLLSTAFTLLGFPHPADPDVTCRRGADGQVVISRNTSTVSAARRAFSALSRAALTERQSRQLLGSVAR